MNILKILIKKKEKFLKCCKCMLLTKIILTYEWAQS